MSGNQDGRDEAQGVAQGQVPVLDWKCAEGTIYPQCLLWNRSRDIPA